MEYLMDLVLTLLALSPAAVLGIWLGNRLH
jgi:hypothetical protein